MLLASPVPAGGATARGVSAPPGQLSTRHCTLLGRAASKCVGPVHEAVHGGVMANSYKKLCIATRVAHSMFGEERSSPTYSQCVIHVSWTKQFLKDPVAYSISNTPDGFSFGPIHQAAPRSSTIAALTAARSEYIRTLSTSPQCLRIVLFSTVAKQAPAVNNALAIDVVSSQSVRVLAERGRDASARAPAVHPISGGFPGGRSTVNLHPT